MTYVLWLFCADDFRNHYELIINKAAGLSVILMIMSASAHTGDYCCLWDTQSDSD